MTIGYTTWGTVRGRGPLRHDMASAERDLAADRHGCRRQGGYSDREVVSIDEDGVLHYLDGSIVWPSHGRSNGAVRVDPDDVRGACQLCSTEDGAEDRDMATAVRR